MVGSSDLAGLWLELKPGDKVEGVLGGVWSQVEVTSETSGQIRKQQGT